MWAKYKYIIVPVVLVALGAGFYFFIYKKEDDASSTSSATSALKGTKEKKETAPAVKAAS